MFDMWARDTEITTVIFACAVFVVFPLQLLLCFKAKKLLIKLLPTVIPGAATLVFFIMMTTSRDWSALLYVILAAFSGVLLFFSAIAWGIYAIARLVAKIKRKNQKV